MLEPMAQCDCVRAIPCQVALPSMRRCPFCTELSYVVWPEGVTQRPAQVAVPEAQHRVMIEAVENHMPQVGG